MSDKQYVNIESNILIGIDYPLSMEYSIPSDAWMDINSVTKWNEKPKEKLRFNEEQAVLRHELYVNILNAKEIKNRLAFGHRWRISIKIENQTRIVHSLAVYGQALRHETCVINYNENVFSNWIVFVFLVWYARIDR